MDPPADAPVFHRFARLYDLVMWRMDPAVLEAGLAHAERPIRRVIDVGGGTGRGIDALAAAERVVVDAAQGMLRGARRRGLETVRGDARELPVADESVDAVLIVDALHHMADHEQVCAEAARVLRPGGVLLVREFDPTTVRGRGLVLAERLVGFDSTFRPPDDLAAVVSAVGLEVAIPDRGFGYTTVGVKATAPT